MKSLLLFSALTASLCAWGQAPAPTPGLPPSAPRAASAETLPDRKPSTSRSSNKSSSSGKSSYEVGGETVYRIETSSGPSRRESIPVSVIRFSSPEPGDSLSMLKEDLQVFGFMVERNLQRAFGGNAPAIKMGIPMYFTGAGRPVQAMYLEGFGALTAWQANFPLLELEEDDDKRQEPSSTADWNDARRELFEPAPPPPLGREEPSGPAYDEEKVDTLKHELFELLKHAANIRVLKGDEFVGITVFGTSVQSGQPEADRKGGVVEDPDPAVLHDGAEKRPGRKSEPALSRSVPRRGAPQGTVLTVRAKKKDVDLFAKGDMSEEDFVKRAQMTAYVGGASDGGQRPMAWGPAGLQRK